MISNYANWYIFQIIPNNFIYLLQIGLINKKIGPYFSYFEIGLSYVDFFNLRYENGMQKPKEQ